MWWLPLIPLSIVLFAIINPYGSRGSFLGLGAAIALLTLGLAILNYLSLRFAWVIKLTGSPVGELYIQFRNEAFIPIYLGIDAPTTSHNVHAVSSPTNVKRDRGTQ
jgi:hypothetical protein